jgi:prolyl 4-hydroxylase
LLKPRRQTYPRRSHSSGFHVSRRTGLGSTAVSASVAEAAHCDARGDHARAVTLLAEAARAGDAEAMTRLGKRLLIAADAPNRPQEGTALLARAAQLGNAEAAAELAVLSAVGMFVPQSWQDAMTAIVFAAERGSEAARGQLRVLSADRELAARTDAAAASDPAIWRRLAETVPLDPWHLPARNGETLHDSPLIHHFPDFVDAGVCAWLIEHARPRLTRAPIYSARQGRAAISDTRTNRWANFDITVCDLVSVLVQVRICANTGAPFRNLEPFAVLHYAVGEEATEHFDFVDPLTDNYEQVLAKQGERDLTFLLYLNDDYDGGRTEMPEIGFSHKGRRGEGFYFVNVHENGQPDRRTLHAGRPPTRGEKWVVSQFIRNRPTF